MDNTNAGKTLFHVKATAGSSVLQKGRHIVVIQSITPDEAVPSEECAWIDPTPQAKVLFKNKEGIFTEWLNLRAFKRFSELTQKQKDSGKFIAATHPEYPGEEYAVERKSKQRVEDPERTETCMGIIGQLGNAAGFDVDDDITEDDLVGKEVGIVVEPNKTGKLRARGFYRANAKAKQVLATA